MKKLSLNLEIDLEPFIKAVEGAEKLEDNDKLFHELAKIQFDKKQLQAANEAFDQVEKLVKQYINDKAKTLYGKEWESIKGTGYKISRSFTGSVYELTGDDVEDDFMQVKLSANTKAIEEYQKEHSALPKGVSVNESRGEQIRINVNVS